jgi:hypothetical protein
MNEPSEQYGNFGFNIEGGIVDEWRGGRHHAYQSVHALSIFEYDGKAWKFVHTEEDSDTINTILTTQKNPEAMTKLLKQRYEDYN